MQKAVLVPNQKFEEIRIGSEIFYINPRYEKLLSKTTQEEDEGLGEDIQKDGQYYDIKINNQRVVLDGHRRIRRFQKLGVVPKYEIKYFDHPLQEELFVIKANTKRRQLTPFEDIMLQKKTILIEQKLEKELSDMKESASNDAKKGGRLREKIAERTPYSPKTVERALDIEKNASKDQIKKLKDHEAPAKIYTIAKELKVKENISKLKKIKFPNHVIGNYFVMDFGWRYKNQKTGGSNASAANQKFLTKTPLEIIEEDVPKIKKIMAKDSVVCLWVTTPLYKEQMKVFDALGLEYKSKIYWVKEDLDKLVKLPRAGGWGYWLNGLVEECLVGITGNVRAFGLKENNVIFGKPKSRIHSQKPDAFYDLIRKTSKKMPGCKEVVDLFGRKERDGFKVLGNQIIRGGKIVNL